MQENNIMIDSIRENNRNFLQFKRQIHRDESKDTNRSITKPDSITKENVTAIANTLKTKSTIPALELVKLKNALLQDQSNIEVVLNVHGALRGLVRELTGNNIVNQCIAAGCLCNLALGDFKACNSIVKAAGPYLVTSLDNMAMELAVTSAWTLGNLASHRKVCEVLVLQGALAKLCERRTGTELQRACVYALLHYVYALGESLSKDYVQKITKTATELEMTVESAQLLFMLSCHQNFTECVTEDLVLKLIQGLNRCMETYKHKHTETNMELVYITRSLANMNTDVYNVILGYFVSYNMCELFKQVLSDNNSFVVESMLWLLGNLYNYCSDEEFFSMLL
ncbi:uncharacterized protein LOC126972837 [Leptidea sinapis]|uniref:uncharacterized protein LOC126972837 n=1 Tax=Leptidea sinapis TaxID=189913 RepID=UPI0021283023|nr:uncharacterized protein LOC126972837 [Leptidea sinapis]